MKKPLILCFLSIAALLPGQLIPQPETPAPAPAKVVADTLVDGVNAQLATRVAALKNLWETLWENPRATPAEILAELGPRGGLVLLAGSLAVDDLEACAAAAGTTATALLGDDKYLTTPVPITVGEDGTVTLQ
jgi:hypothetical protein